MTTPVTLAIDAGQSGSRMVLAGPGVPTVSWTDVGVPPGMAPLRAITGPLLDGAVRHLRDNRLDPPEVVGAGLTGFHDRAAGAAQALDAWHARLGVRRLSLADDAVTSYLGALGDAPGAVVAAGTGVTVLATTARSWVRVNGWGPTLGDEGGGFWVGQEGLRSAFRWLDGRGGSERLATEAHSRFASLRDLPGVIAESSDRVALVASFAPRVAAAAHDGDAEATRIWTAAGHQLASAVVAAVRRVGASDPAASGRSRISWNGSLFEAGDLLLAPFRHAIQSAIPLAEVVEPRSSALDGALGLAGACAAARLRGLVDTAEIE